MNNINKCFKSIFSEIPVTIKNGIPYFGSEFEGDQFTDDDVASWTAGGRFATRWANKGTENEYRNKVYLDLCRRAANLNLPVMEIACGPGLGLLPDIYAINPAIQALATDACPAIVEKWSDFLNQYAPAASIEFASFNAAKMPVHSDSIDVITSNIGFSSLRYAGADNMHGIEEAYRVLKPGGVIFAIENEFEDMNIIQRVFDLWGRENWFKDNKLTWSERFKKAGFIIEQEKISLRRIEKDDWELGEAAASFGLEIAMIFKAFVLRKPEKGTTEIR